VVPGLRPRGLGEGAGLPVGLVGTGWVVTGPRPRGPGEGAGLPVGLVGTGWVVTGPRPRGPGEGAFVPGLGLSGHPVTPIGGLTGPLPVYPAGGFPPRKRDM
jgi:hypothetical protein